MTKKELILEKRHAKFMYEFFKPYKHTAHEKYNVWRKRYNQLKELTK